MANIYTRRQQPNSDAFRYDFDPQTLRRTYHALRGACERHRSHSFARLLEEMEQSLLEEYGELEGMFGTGYSHGDNAVQEHLLRCPTDKVLDFFELLFQCQSYLAGSTSVEIVNRILQEDGIGFGFSAYVLPPMEDRHAAELYLMHDIIWDRDKIQFPQAIKKTSQYAHQEIVQPCLDLLSDPKFRIANDEMLKAHKEYREGNYADAITDCGSAFETVMKTICEAKGWPYNKGKATCKDLVDVCRDNGLFPGFYAPFFIDAGTIRNKLGDAHGKGPTPEFTSTKEHFEHMVQITSANILLLARLASI